MKLYTQLNFGGNCEEAFRFYEKNLGGQVTMLVHQSEMPGPPRGAGEKKADPVIHARLSIGDTVLIGNDVPPDVFKPMRSVYLYLSVDSTAEAERLYKLLGDGGEIFMPLEKTFFAERFSMLRDRFGVSWSLIHEQPNNAVGA